MDIPASQDFVQSVMSVPITNVVQCVSDLRKRHLTNGDSEQDCVHKKQKGESDTVDDQNKVKSTSHLTVGTTDVRISDNSDVLTAIGELIIHFDKRLDSLEDKLMLKMKEFVCDEIDKVKKNLSDNMAAVRKQVTNLKSDQDRINNRLEADIKNIKETRVKSYADVVTDNPVHQNIILKNVVETLCENVKAKVNSVIRDGLGLRDIEVDHAVRKESRHARYPGVIVATCRSTEDKEKILEGKRRLSDTRNFRDVYINSDKPLQQRINEANMRMIVKSIGDDSLQVNGGRIRKQPRQQHRQHTTRYDDRGYTRSYNRGYTRDESPTRADVYKHRSRGDSSSSSQRRDQHRHGEEHQGQGRRPQVRSNDYARN